jgi:hypothetical protein
LLTCLAVPRWAAEVVDGRPYDTLAALTKQAEAAAATLTDDELAAPSPATRASANARGGPRRGVLPAGAGRPWRRTTS